MNDPRLKYHELGFLQVVDLPSPEYLKAYYEDSYYQSESGNFRKSYSDVERCFLRAKIAQKSEYVFKLRKSREAGSLLDVGCGEGFALDWFQEQGWSVEGIDHSVAGLEAMNPHLLPNVESGDIFGILNNRINKAKVYDTVWLNNVLEHVIDPVGLLSSLRQLMARNGVLVVTVPNDGSVYQENLLEHGDIPNRFWIAIPDHLAYFSHDSLVSISEGTGWVCNNIIGDFPIDLFLLHPGSNYVLDRTNGPGAHQARIRMELMLSQYNHDHINELYGAMARVGLGRNLTAFLSCN